ncbi:MAG: L-aspartate oxidase [Acidimicrobiia bacterium]
MRYLDGPLVVGSGVAGLSVALAARGATVLTRGELAADGSSHWAQGGVAAALAADDSPGLHAADTVAVAAGIPELAAVEALAELGPDAVRRLIDLGASFDRDPDGGLALGREAGHSVRRIVHAHGDATGAEVMRTLAAATLDRPDLEVLEHHAVVDLVRGDDGSVVGVVAESAGERVVLLAPAVVLATGGYGRLYDRTTNPEYVNGDGVAIAARAGARLADLEFVQFHPTALDVGADPAPLLTEALRGEGARLVDAGGHRYMPAIHPDAELAPRDVVARANWRQRDSGAGAFLDARHLADGFPQRFPTVFALATEHGLDPRADLLPVAPAAHYSMGGIDTDLWGRTSLPGLFAVGEASSTGVHGANRLASNSLLEGLVFGARVAAVLPADQPSAHPAIPVGAFDLPWGRGPEHAQLRALMSRHAGVVRSDDGLGALLDWLAAADVLDHTIDGRNARLLATLVSEAALARTESRGGHHRLDFPEPDPQQARRRRVIPAPVPTTSPAVGVGR